MAAYQLTKTESHHEALVKNYNPLWNQWDVAEQAISQTVFID